MKSAPAVFGMILLGFATQVDGEAQPRVRAGSVGVAYMEVGDTELRLVFPSSTAKSAGQKEKTPIEIGGELVLFDAKGSLGRIQTAGPASLRRWCKSHGGMQFRPELAVPVPKKLKRNLVPIERLQR